MIKKLAGMFSLMIHQSFVFVQCVGMLLLFPLLPLISGNIFDAARVISVVFVAFILLGLLQFKREKVF